MNKRLSKVKEYLQKSSADALVITDPKNMRYLASYTGEGYLVITPEDNFLFTDFRYIIQAREQTKEFVICNIAEDFDFSRFKNAYFEDKTISYGMYSNLTKKFANLIPLGDYLLEMRAVKDKEEIVCISKAQSIADMAFLHILDFIKPDVAERDLALELEFFMRNSGAESVSFDTIVAAGAHSAMPHAEPGESRIKNGDFVVMDFGCVYGGYSSDMTRTVCLGKATPDMKKVYDTVLSAQLSSLQMVRAGQVASDIHCNAQQIIDSSYKGTFGHGLGHGVGLDIHESPNLSPRNNNPLAAGNVVTVEPGIYLDGFYGVRIEDMVVVCEDKCINLTKSDKKLIEL